MSLCDFTAFPSPTPISSTTFSNTFSRSTRPKSSRPTFRKSQKSAGFASTVSLTAVFLKCSHAASELQIPRASTSGRGDPRPNRRCVCWLGVTRSDFGARRGLSLEEELHDSFVFSDSPSPHCVGRPKSRHAEAHTESSCAGSTHGGAGERLAERVGSIGE